MSMLMSIFSNSSFLNKKLVSVSMLECHEYADIQKFAKQVPLYLLSAFTYPSIKSKARLLQHIFSKYLSSRYIQGRFLRKKNKLSTLLSDNRVSQRVSRYLATLLVSRNSNSREHNFKVKHDFELTHSSMLMLTKKPELKPVARALAFRSRTGGSGTGSGRGEDDDE